MTESSSSFTDQERQLLEARARAVAPRQGDSAGDGLGEELIVVRCGAGLYGLRGRDVIAVAALTRLSPLPLGAPHVAGLTAFRGTVLVVFHLYAVLGAPPTLSEYGRMVVLDDECALAVDVVERLEPLQELRPAPIGLVRAATLIEGVTESGVAVLSVEALRQSESFVVDISVSDVASWARTP